MKKNKSIFILSALLILSTSFAIYSKYQEKKLRVQLNKITKQTAISHKDSLVKNEIPVIDSLLIKGDYENALSAYEKEFNRISPIDKAPLQFRIEIANQFLNLDKKTPKAKQYIAANTQKEGQPLSNSSSHPNFESLKSTTNSIANNAQKSQKEEKSNSEYLTFKSSKDHELHYVGEISDGKANGNGTAIFDTGSRYKGEWKNNLRDGQGVFYWNDGQYYEGQYKNDLRTGTGSYFWPNGEKYIGEWKKDKRHGEGTFYHKNGKIVKGVWKKDKLVKEFKKDSLK